MEMLDKTFGELLLPQSDNKKKRHQYNHSFTQNLKVEKNYSYKIK